MHRSYLVVAVLVAACANPPNPNLAPDGGGTERDGGGPGPGPTIDADPDAPDAIPAIGCSGTGAASQPFGNHEHSLAAGVITPSHVSTADLDQGVREVYDAWKAEYLRAGCGANRYYVDVRGGDSLTVSEAHGYGMLLTAYMAGYDANAHAAFDGLYRYYTDHPSSGNSNLMAWSQDHGCNDNLGGNSASDGDLDIAYALLLADKQWGSNGDIDYFGQAVRIIGAIADSDIDNSGSWVLLGDWATPDSGDYYNATRPSDFMPGHFAAFEHVVGDGGWRRVTDRSYTTIEQLQSRHAASTGLIPDFVLDPVANPRPAPGNFLERPVDGEYSFNACRVPWRLGVHVAATGDPRGRAALQRMTGWLRASTDNNPGNIRAGYWRDGDGLPGSGYLEMAFAAPFGVGAMVDADNQVWLNNLWDTVRWRDMTGVYYGDTLRVLSLLAMSGNWWVPEAAPCPD